MLEYPIARAYADARITTIYGGTTEIMKEIIGRGLGVVSDAASSRDRNIGSRARTEGAEGTRAGRSQPNAPDLRGISPPCATPTPFAAACSPLAIGAGSLGPLARHPGRAPLRGEADRVPGRRHGDLHRHLRRLPRRLRPHPRGPGPDGQEDAAPARRRRRRRCTASRSTTRRRAATPSRSRPPTAGRTTTSTSTTTRPAPTTARPPEPRPSRPTSSSAPRCAAARWSATWATPATPRPPAPTSTSRSASRPPPGSYTGTPINPYESLRQATVWSTASRWELRRTATAGRRRRAVRLRVQRGDRALLCDWDGDGADEAVIYRAGTWHLRSGTSTGGHAPASSRSAPRATLPLCGDVDGDGARRAGAVPGRHVDRPRRVRAPATASPGPRAYGVQAGDKPVLGDWDGDGDDDLGDPPRRHLAPPQHRHGGRRHGHHVPPTGSQPSDQPVAGDWDGDGDDDAGHLPQRQWYLRSTAEASGGDRQHLRVRRADGPAARRATAPTRSCRASAPSAPARPEPSYRRRRSLAMWVIWISSVPA